MAVHFYLAGHEFASFFLSAICFKAISAIFGIGVSPVSHATYTEAALAVIRSRLTQAGARLGWLLNEGFQNKHT